MQTAKAPRCDNFERLKIPYLGSQHGRAIQNKSCILPDVLSIVTIDRLIKSSKIKYMGEWRQPPIAKVYEALGCVADGRVRHLTPTSARVDSSTGDKFYTVEWAENLEWINSNDNASFWQGYIGYPIIAVLLLGGQLPYNKLVSDALKGIAWKSINTKYKNDYSKTIDEILAVTQERGVPPDLVKKECETILLLLSQLKLKRPDKKKSAKTTAEKQDSFL